MNCQACNAETKVIDSRQIDGSMRRRRQCVACGERFSTVEVPLDRLHQVRAKPASAKPKPAPKPKPVPTKKARGESRRRIENMRERRRYSDVWTPDNDFLPDY